MKSFAKTLMAALAAALLAAAPAQQALAQGDAPPAKRVVNVKAKITPKGSSVKLKDIVQSASPLSDEEKELEITEAPTSSDETVSIVSLAYMLQRYPELMNVRLVGPRNIVIQKVSDSSAAEKAKADIVSQIKGMAPWKDWDIDVMLSSSDETIISKAWPFAKVELLPSDNKTMTGPVVLNVAFINESGRQASKTQLNPTILRKVSVVVLNSNCRQGQIITESALKKVPMWLGPENRDYIADFSECLGRELAKPMSAGDVLKSGDVLNPVCAKRGDMIWVECRSGALSVKLAVTALEGGRQGEMIKVLNQPTQKTFSVQLVGEKQGLYSFGS